MTFLYRGLKLAHYPHYPHFPYVRSLTINCLSNEIYTRSSPGELGEQLMGDTYLRCSGVAVLRVGQ